jgi:hypothetical protein
LAVEVAVALWRWRGLVCAAAALALGCEPELCDEVEGAPTATVGTGTARFRAVQDGDALTYVRGIQGGTHLDGSVAVRGVFLPPDSLSGEQYLPLLTMLLADEAGTRLGGFTALPTLFDVQSDGSGVRVGEQVIFDADASAFVGQRVRLSAEVLDFCGTVVQDSVEVVVAESG